MGQAAEQNDLTTNFLLSGVGGQGTLLAADVVALVGVELGLEAKKSEIHGMAQRGGSVVSQVRWGRRVYSPMIPAGEADVLVAFERLEALRYADQMRPGGILLVNDYAIAPISVTSGNDTYPTPEQENAAYAGQLRVYRVPAMEIARQVGPIQVMNVVLLGALSAVLPVDEGVWLEVLARRVPERTLDVNWAAFAAGRVCLEGAQHAQ